MTKKSRTRHNAAVISSTMPSAKYSCSGSPLMFWNGRTTIDGSSGSGSTGEAEEHHSEGCIGSQIIRASVWVTRPLYDLPAMGSTAAEQFGAGRFIIAATSPY